MTQPRKTKGIPDIVDKHVGQQLRNRRTLMGLSQEKLAEHIGVTFQQVQKYERGTNRISASRLLSFSKILEVSIDYFYDGLEGARSYKRLTQGMADNSQESFSSEPLVKELPEDIFTRKETIDLLKTYYTVSDQEERKSILKFVKSMVKKVS